jgi:ATP-dependent DNA helicase RecG
MLDERPPGRKPIATALRRESARDRVLQFIDRQLDAGRQGYIVYPVIEESEKTDLKAATTMYELLSADRSRRVALLHGRIPGDERDAIMRRSATANWIADRHHGDRGIDVSNATVMLIEHLSGQPSQLHQLPRRARGRGVVLHPARRREPGRGRALSTTRRKTV